MIHALPSNTWISWILMLNLALYDHIKVSILSCQHENCKFPRIKLQSETKWISIVHDDACSQAVSLILLDSVNHFDGHNHLYHIIPTPSETNGDAFGLPLPVSSCVLLLETTLIKFMFAMRTVLFSMILTVVI